jgi:predicted acylesterase/phospholipase RssA/CRP-like cAMP-binding protein
MDPRLLFPATPSSSTTSAAPATVAAISNANNNGTEASPFSNYLPEIDSKLSLPHPDSDPVEQLLSSAKLFAVMELEASRKLYNLCNVITLAPFEQLFSAGDASDSGVYIVTEGKLGSYLDNRKQNHKYSKNQQAGNSSERTSFDYPDRINTHLVHISTLSFGNSIGDLDVLDGAPRSVTTTAMETGCRLLQINRKLFLKTVVENPRVLQSYLNSSIARLWRVGHFTLRDFLQLPLEALSSPPGGIGYENGNSGLNKNNAAGIAGGGAFTGAAKVRGNGAGTSTITGTLTGEQAITLAEAVLSPPIAADAAAAESDARAAATATIAAIVQDRKQNNKAGKPKRRVSFSDEQMTAIIDEDTTAITARISRPSSPAQHVAAPPGAVAAASPPKFSLSPAPSTSSSLPVMVHTHYASLGAGWDVLTPEESSLEAATLALLLSTAAAITSAGNSNSAEESLSPTPSTAGRAIQVTPGTVLMDLDEPVDQFFILIEGSLVIERAVHGKKRKETALVAPGSLIGGGSFISSTNSRAKAWAVGEGCLVVAIGQEHIDKLISEAEEMKRGRATSTSSLIAEKPSNAASFKIKEKRNDDDDDDDDSNKDTESVESMHTASEGGVQSRSASQQSIQSMISACSTTNNDNDDTTSTAAGAVVTDLLLAAARALGPTIRQFISYGLTREWYHAGEVVYRAGQPAESLYIIISGRARLLHVSTSSLGSAGASVTGAPAVEFRVEDDVGRGDSMGAVWTISGGRHDTTCLCARDVEAVRMSKASFELLAASRPKAAARVLQGMAERLAAANTSRRVATGNFGGTGLNTAGGGGGGAGGAGGGGGGAGKRGEIATIAILPAGTPLISNDNNSNDDAEEILHNDDAVSQLAEALRAHLESSFGPASLLDFATVQRMFPTESEHLEVPFFRSKVTTWLNQQEEDCRFIILQGGGSRGDGKNNDGDNTTSISEWSRICADQADCILLAATAATTDPEISVEEDALVWKSMQTAARRLQRAFSTTVGAGGKQEVISAFASVTGAQPLHPFEAAAEFGNAAFLEALQYTTTTASVTSSGSPTATSTSVSAATAASFDPSLISLRRVELVLLHPSNTLPHGTAAWLQSRPHLTRHHHVRLSRPDSVARLGRWMAGAAVGVVLSGGGSRGLAHLGILRALHDAGVPIDVVGGTSQGAMISALFAQDGGWPLMQKVVRRYASEMGNARRLAADLTFPVLSVFKGAALDQVVQEAFEPGPHRIEDLWLRFFCVTTNLTTGSPSIHQHGVLWRAVRASMTLIGLVPPVVDELGQLLCDGGYSDNLPVAAMRDQVGTSGTVIVVDVEDRDHSAWHNLSPTDGGISGWQLLWDRWCPVERWRYGIRIPNHASLMNSLTWMAHKQNLARLAREGQRVDLYLRPPVTQYRLMDYHLADRIALEANRYAFLAIAQWQRLHGGRGNVPFSAQQVVEAAELGSSSSSFSQNGIQSTVRMKTTASLHHPKEEKEDESSVKQQQLQRRQSPKGPLQQGHRLAGAPDSKLKRRSSSVRCMTQLQAKHAESEEDEDTSSSSTSDGLMAPLQLLTRAATAHPSLAAAHLTNMTAAQRLAPLEEVSGEISSPPLSFRSEKSSGEKESEKGEDEVGSTVAAAETPAGAQDDTSPPASEAAPPEPEAAVSTEKEDQYAYLDNIEIEFNEDDLPS